MKTIAKMLSNKFRGLKNYDFQHMYLKEHNYEMARRNTRKNLLILSLVYAGIIAFAGFVVL